jgi:predicted nucleic acid-binding protein
MELIVDTTVLIDLWRFGDKPEKIAQLIDSVGDASLIVPWITQAEFSRGALYKGVSMEGLDQFYRSFLLMALDKPTMDRYCELWGKMARKGKAPDYPDLWIAACASVRKTPLVTRNPKHFAAIPDLTIISYELG